jgi:hypothetical protein
VTAFVPYRLGRLYVTSRRIPSAGAALVACALVLHLVLHWTPASGTFATQLPLLVIGAAAAVIGATHRSPFGDAERATGLRLPVARFAASLCLAAAGYGILAAGAADARLIFGATGLLRDLVGIVGVTLLTAALASGNLAWLGTLSYLLLAMSAVAVGWTTPWLWPARPPMDTGAAVCAVTIYLVGLIAVTVRGTRESGRD